MNESDAIEILKFLISSYKENPVIRTLLEKVVEYIEDRFEEDIDRHDADKFIKDIAANFEKRGPGMDYRETSPMGIVGTINYHTDKTPIHQTKEDFYKGGFNMLSDDDKREVMKLKAEMNEPIVRALSDANEPITEDELYDLNDAYEEWIEMTNKDKQQDTISSEVQTDESIKTHEEDQKKWPDDQNKKI